MPPQRNTTVLDFEDETDDLLPPFFDNNSTINGTSWDQLIDDFADFFGPVDDKDNQTADANQTSDELNNKTAEANSTSTETNNQTDDCDVNGIFCDLDSNETDEQKQNDTLEDDSHLPYCQQRHCFDNLGQKFCESQFCNEDFNPFAQHTDDDEKNKTSDLNETDSVEPVSPVEPAANQTLKNDTHWCETKQCSQRWDDDFCSSAQCYNCSGELCTISDYLNWQEERIEQESLAMHYC